MWALVGEDSCSGELYLVAGAGVWTVIKGSCSWLLGRVSRQVFRTSATAVDKGSSSRLVVAGCWERWGRCRESCQDSC